MPKSLLDNFTDEQFIEIISQSNSYKDALKKFGYSSLGGTSYKTIEKRVQKLQLDVSHFNNTKNNIKRNEENVFCINSTASQKTLREWYVKGNYTEYKCSICGLPPEWQGKPLVLTLDHINGNSKDDRLENLRWVCPNCDRQLPTYSRGARGLK